MARISFIVYIEITGGIKYGDWKTNKSFKTTKRIYSR